MELYQGNLPVIKILENWYAQENQQNKFGAFIPFVGTVRAENNIDGLSFDIYKPLLEKWYLKWVAKADSLNAKIKFAHSIGDVKVSESSYISAVFSPKRAVALNLINEFVEDFKANAPIWKYDIINGKRVYAESRSQKIQGSGLLKLSK